jgi:Kef-type K+ transport system membrane component KefB
VSVEQLILSLGVILLAARLVGRLCQFIGQPRVMGEMIAGIILGPSVLGAFFPSTFARIFPVSSLPTLNALSQIGLLLFMFVVGLEVDLQQIFKQQVSVVLTSNFGILLPFALGLALARVVYPELAAVHMRFFPFALFMGTAMSITAFPVLARILRERGLLSTELGSMAISCAAVDDVTAWLLLAILTAIVRSAADWLRLAQTLLLLSGFIVLMLLPVRRAIAFLQQRYATTGARDAFFFGLILMMLGASWATERLGVHPLFGAFLAGLVVPKQQGLAARTAAHVEAVTLALLLPLFFALTGLRTRVDLLHNQHLWAYALAILLVAIAGKLLGASLTCRFTGKSWRDSLAIGVLMNTRGLVELVVLNAGLELGIISPALFTMMVLMALVTTFMSSPLLELLKISPARTRRDALIKATAHDVPEVTRVGT